MNTEKFVIFETEKDGKKHYVNRLVGFIGNIEEAKQYAAQHNYGGGIEIIIKKNKKQ
jgi:hypothetical protein